MTYEQLTCHKTNQPANKPLTYYFTGLSIAQTLLQEHIFQEKKIFLRIHSW